MSLKQIDFLNIGMIFLSLAVAIYLPFWLFLFAYALLGPLHFLTQINWLHDKEYYARSKSLIWLLTSFAFLFAVPYLLGLDIFSQYYENADFVKTADFFWNNINAMIMVAFFVAIAFVFTKKTYLRIIIGIAGLLLAIFLRSNYFYNIWIGLFVPTVLHVFVFTLLFMIYGALKNNSIPGYISAAILFVVPFIILAIDVDPKSYFFSDTLKNTFLITGFQIVNAKLAGVLGLSDGAHFYFYEKLYLKVQIFISFAYTYHYLNWFTKTSIIGWKNSLTKRSTLIIFILWIISAGLYWYDYKTGFALLIFLSLLHVFAEFPLNIVSVKGIISYATKNTK